MLILAGCMPSLLDGDLVDRAVLAGAEVDAERLDALVRDLVAAHETEEAVIWPDFSGDKPYRHKAATAWLEDQLRSLGHEPIVEHNDYGSLSAANVYVDLPGETDEIVVLSAHHDAWYTPADDNATGVAILLEAVRVLGPHDLRRTVRVISFAPEEVNQFGSSWHYDAHQDEQIVANINLDSVGYTGTQSSVAGFDLGDEGDFVLGVSNGPGLQHASWMAQLAGRTPTTTRYLGAVATGNADWPFASFQGGDHGPPWDQGIPGVFLTDTAGFRNPHYHKASDLPDTLDPTFHRGVGELTVAATYAFADVP